MSSRIEVTLAVERAIAEAVARELGFGETTVSKYRPRGEDGPATTLGLSEDRIKALVAAAVQAYVGNGNALANSAKAEPSAPAELTATLRKRYRKVPFASVPHYPFQRHVAIGAHLDFAHDDKPDLFVGDPAGVGGGANPSAA